MYKKILQTSATVFKVNRYYILALLLGSLANLQLIAQTPPQCFGNDPNTCGSHTFNGKLYDIVI